jgi:hypothetical protein
MVIKDHTAAPMVAPLTKVSRDSRKTSGLFGILVWDSLHYPILVVNEEICRGSLMDKVGVTNLLGLLAVLPAFYLAQGQNNIVF